MQNLKQQIQMPWSHKPKTFSGFFIAFLKYAWNLELFRKSDDCPSLIIPEIVDSETHGYLNV